MIVELLLVLITLAFFFAYSTYTSNHKLLVGYKGPKGLPLLGNVLDFPKGSVSEQILPFISSLIEEYGPRTRFFIGWTPNAIIATPEDAEKILGNSIHIHKGGMYKFFKEWIGQGLSAASGPKWQLRRKLLTPAFHYKILEDFIPVINEHAQNLLTILHSNMDNKYTNMSKRLSNVTLDITCETAMGRKVKAQQNPDSPYVVAIRELLPLIMTRMFTPWLSPEFIWKRSSYGKLETKDLKIIHGFANQVIDEKLKHREDKRKDPNYINPTVLNDDDIGTKKRRAFLDLLLDIQEQNPKDITNKDVLDDVETFLLAGTDSSSTALEWALLLLGNHPEIQDKVHEELDSIFGDDTTRHITLDDARRMEYTELVIKETLRMFPPVPNTMRHIESPLVLDDGVVVKPGVTAWVCVYHIHYNQKYWKSPEKFIPERFTAENSRGQHPYAYLPFSAGPRNCVGQRFAMLMLKVVLGSIMRKFKVKSERRMEDIKLVSEVMLVPEGGANVQLSLRV